MELGEAAPASAPDGASPTAHPSRPATWALTALSCVLFVVAFAATADGLRRALPRAMPVLGPKITYFAGRKDTYSTVFVGTSVMYRHVVPQLFDDEARAAGGADEHSFNFGAPRMTLAEAYVVVDGILGSHPARLKRLVVDASLFVDSGEANYFTSRHLHWHTAQETLFVVRDALASDTTRDKKIDRITIDLKAFVRNASAAGRVSEIFRAGWDSTFGADEEDDAPVEDEGYRTLDEERTRSVLKRKKRFEKSQAQYLRQLAARKRKRPATPTPYTAVMLGRIVDRIRSAGVEAVVVESPLLKPPMALGEVVKNAKIVSFNDPDAYPDLYEAEVRFDESHLNDEGAHRLTRHLARALAPAPSP